MALPDVSKAAREQRRAAWQAGVDWCQGEHLIRRALAECSFADLYDQHLYLQGIANELMAAGRRIAGLNPLEERGL